MTVSDGDVIKAVASFVEPTAGAQQNAWHWIAQFASDQTDAAVLAAIISALGDIYDEFAAHIDADMDDPDIAVDVVEWQTDEWVTVARVGEGVAGTNFAAAGENLPPQCAPYFVMRTSRPRSNGRKFMPVIDEGAQNGGWLTSAAATALGNTLTEALTDITISAGNDLVPGVASTVTGTFLPFLNGFISGVLGTQRRRKYGIGA